ncbi:LOW QUALITY PROTEIN: AF4/FMR2 family member 1-like [Chionomys nivalis]|uniref:LOW QUALITY PROTEIN: AF4/FMR2 family member 1-like n=1 Tax=Chionomys nivalis TaxID=269649 RepID=UPI00259A1385|nr:LOW QUALITY PROTEIN: AF4/FMR2 family member 1-like [Chionomys nivalis]
MSTFHWPPLTAFKDSSENSNLLRTREKERGKQEDHPEKEAFFEKMPLFGEPYKTTKRDGLSRQIQNILGDYEVMKELWRSVSCTQCPNGSKDSRGKPKYPLFHDRESLASTFCCTHTYHQLFCTSSAPGSPFVGNISHSSKMAPPRMEPVPSLHAKNYGPPDKQHPTRDHLSQEGHSSNHKKCDRRADGDSALGKKLSPLISPVSHLSPVHSRLQRTSKVYSSSSTSNKSYCANMSSKGLKIKVQDNETPLDSSVVITRLGVASSQTFPPLPLLSESVAMQQKPMTCIWPTDGQNQAPSESLGLKLPLEDNGQQSFEKLDVKVPDKAKLTRLKISSQSESVEQLFSNEVHCVEEILKEMTHSWLPPLTTKHTPSTAKSSRSPFPTKDPLPNSSATQSQNQYDPLSKIHPNSQQGTSILWEDLQLSESEESDTEQAAEKLPSLSAPPSAPQILPKPVVSAHSSSAKSESSSSRSDSDSDSDSERDSESESSSRYSKESEPLEIPAPEPETPTTNWLTKVKQPLVLLEALGGTESPSGPQENKGENLNTDQLHPESKGSPPKSSCKAVQELTEGPQPEERSCQKPSAQQQSPSQQTIETKQPRKPAKVSGQAEPQACLQVESKPGPLPSESKKQISKDKPKVKAKGREPKPEASMPNHQAAEPAPKEKRKHKGSPAPSKVSSGPQPPKDKARNRNSFTPPHSGGSNGRSSNCQQTANVQEDGQKRDTELLSPLRNTPLPPSLVVKINLHHLTRIPQPLGKGGSPRKAEDRQPPADKEQDSEKRDCNGSSRLSKKRKGSDSEKDRASKKIRREKDVQSHCTSSSSSHTESSKTKTSKASSESSRKEMPSLPPVSASSSSQKSIKTARKKPKTDVDTCGQGPPKSAGSANDNDKDSSVPKHRKVPKVQARGSEYIGSSREATNAFLVPSLPKGNCKPGKPQVKPYKQKADFYMKEAKRMKCKAVAMKNKIRKAIKYLEAVLSLIKCGMAKESESSVKAAYTVYSETADLIKFTMSLKSFSDAMVPAQEKIFAVLCLRCQSLVNMAMFRCKKDIVMKYSHSPSDHFNNSSLCTGIPSSLSLVPSPARSVRSQSSAGGMTATVSVPVTIQNKTFAYFTITNHLLKALELWEQSEALTKKNKKFFAQLSTKVRILTLNSSLVDLVIDTKQGLRQLKQTLKTP